MLYEYKDLVFDDVVIEDEGGENWSQICSSCVNTHYVSQSLLSPCAVEVICGVFGCQNEADHIITFPDNQLVEVDEEDLENNNQ